MTLAIRSDFADVGLEWVGPVPKTWEVRRLGHYFEERREKASDKDFLPLSVTMKGVVPQLENVAKTDDGDNRKLVRSGDFVINSRSDRKGSAGIAPRDGSVSLINTVLEPRKAINHRFASWLLTSYPFQEEFYRVGSGIVADMWTTKYSEMKNIRLAVPDLHEQQAIAEFLDSVTARIDTLVAKKTRFIELLREKRQSLITHAVTKGLDATVPMKDSGVEWLGEVPERWTVKRLRFVGEAVIGLTYDPSEVVDESEGVLVLRSSNVQGGKITFDDNVFVSAHISNKLITQVGDILICSRNGSRALIGKNAKIELDSAGVTFGAFMTIFRSGINDFLFYVFNSMIFDYQSGSFMTTTINQLTVGNLYEFEVPLPPLDEQASIVAHLNRNTARIDTLIAKTERTIELLREHRTALITAAVTGKIDLRDPA